MIQVTDIPFTAYPVADKQRARDFYEGILNLRMASGAGSGDFPDGFFWIEYELGTQALALSNFWKSVPGESVQVGPSIGLEVENFDQTIAELKAKNVPFTTEPMETPVCRLAVVLDPDKNSLFIHKRKPGHN